MIVPIAETAIARGASSPIVLIISAKMTARLQAATASGKPVWLRVDYEAGHGSFNVSQKQRNEAQADILAFLFEQLK